MYGRPNVSFSMELPYTLKCFTVFALHKVAPWHQSRSLVGWSAVILTCSMKWAYVATIQAAPPLASTWMIGPSSPQAWSNARLVLSFGINGASKCSFVKICRKSRPWPKPTKCSNDWRKLNLSGRSTARWKFSVSPLQPRTDRTPKSKHNVYRKALFVPNS